MRNFSSNDHSDAVTAIDVFGRIHGVYTAQIRKYRKTKTIDRTRRRQGQHFWAAHATRQKQCAPGWARTTNLSVNSRTRQPIAPRRPFNAGAASPLELTSKSKLSCFQKRTILLCFSQATHAAVRYGLVVRIPGSHPGGPGSIPGNGNPFLNLMVDSLSVRVFPAWICFLHLPVKRLTKNVDEDGIRTHACRAHWISSPTP